VKIEVIKIAEEKIKRRGIKEVDKGDDRKSGSNSKRLWEQRSGAENI
jgi:hypothetical protein